MKVTMLTWVLGVYIGARAGVGHELLVAFIGVGVLGLREVWQEGSPDRRVRREEEKR